MKNQLTIFEVFESERVIPDTMIGHRTVLKQGDHMVYHTPDNPPVIVVKAEIFMPRVSIPRPQILAFISGQVDRLQTLYSDLIELNPVKGRSARSPFHC